MITYFISLVMAFTSNLLSEFKLMDGGVIGLSLFIHYVMEINLGIVYFSLSFFLLFIVFRYDKKLVKHTIYGILVYSINLYLLNKLQMPKLHLPYYVLLFMIANIRACLYVLCKQMNFSMGGSTPLVILLERHKKIKMSLSFILIDITVLLLSLVYFGMDKFLRSVLFVVSVSLFVEMYSYVAKRYVK